MSVENSSDKLRIKEAKKFFGVSESFLRHNLVARVITPYKLGRCTFVSKKEIEGLIEAGAVK